MFNYFNVAAQSIQHFSADYRVNIDPLAVINSFDSKNNRLYSRKTAVGMWFANKWGIRGGFSG